MQKNIHSTIMPPTQSPSNSTQEIDSNKTTHVPEPENPFLFENDCSESKNSKPDDDDDDSAKRSHEAESESVEPNRRRELVEEEEEEEEKESKCCATVSPKSDGTVEDGGCSVRERLKRHGVEVAGRIWIPDTWGQEGFLKDWVDCAAFDASLVNSSILLARDSLMEEGRRANSTRLSIQNGC